MSTKSLLMPYMTTPRPDDDRSPWSLRSAQRPSAPSRAGQLPRPHEHRIEHLLRELPGERVLLARVVGAEQHRPVLGSELRPMAELRLGAQPEQAARRVPGEGAQA